jgi:hypothetical protein
LSVKFLKDYTDSAGEINQFEKGPGRDFSLTLPNGELRIKS